MLPTIEWRDGAVVMVDQRKLPSEEVYVECRTAPEVAKAIKTMVIRGAPAIGVAAAMGLALGVETSKATGTQKLAAEFYRLCELMAAHAADGGQPVLGDRPDEGVVCRGRDGGRIGGSDQGAADRRGASHPRRGCGELPRDRRAWRGRRARRQSRPDALQCRRAGDGRLRHRARRHSRRDRTAARRSPSSPTRPARSCRAPASPRGSW